MHVRECVRACVSVLLAGRCHLLTANRTSPTMNGVFYKRVLWLASSMVVPHKGDNVSGCKHAHKALLLRVPYWRFAHICIMGTHAVRAVGHTSRHTHDKEQQQRQPPMEPYHALLVHKMQAWRAHHTQTQPPEGPAKRVVTTVVACELSTNNAVTAAAQPQRHLSAVR